MNRLPHNPVVEKKPVTNVNVKTNSSGVRYHVPVSSTGQTANRPPHPMIQTSRPVVDNEKTTLRLPPLPVAKAVKQGHPCNLCEKQFATKRDLRLHLYIHKEKPSLACSVCNKNFTTQYQLKKHERSHNPRRRLSECSICKQLFAGSKELEEHHREEHMGQKLYHCEVCGAVFSWQKNLEKHVRSHQEQNHHCSLCGRGFWDMTSLRVHIRNFHSNPGVKDQPYCCSVCGKTFKFDFSYEAHLNAHEMYGQTVKKAPGENSASDVFPSPHPPNTAAPSIEAVKTTTAELLTPDGESREIVVEIVNVPQMGPEPADGEPIADAQIQCEQDEGRNRDQKEEEEEEEKGEEQEQHKQEQDGEVDEKKEEFPPPPLAVINGDDGGNTVQLSLNEPALSPSVESPPELPPLDLEDSVSPQWSSVPKVPPKQKYELSDDDDDGDDTAPTLPPINDQPLNGNPNRATEAPPRLDPIIIRPRTGPGKITTMNAPYIQASNRPKKPKPQRKTTPQPLLYNFVMSEEKPFRCETCLETFRWEISLQIHERDHHTVGQPVKIKRGSAPRSKPGPKKKKDDPVGVSQILRSRASSDEEDDYDAMAMISLEGGQSPEKKKKRQSRRRKAKAGDEDGDPDDAPVVKRRRGAKKALNEEQGNKVKVEGDKPKRRRKPEGTDAGPRKTRGRPRKKKAVVEADLEKPLVEPEVQSPNEVEAYMKEFEALAQKQVEAEQYIVTKAESDEELNEEDEEEDEDEEVKQEEAEEEEMEEEETEEREEQEEEEEMEEEEAVEEVHQSLPRSFTAHIRWTRKLHFMRGAFVCRFCTKVFTTKQSCKIHQLRHTGKHCMPCVDCDRKFPNSSGLVIHRVQHTWSDPLACGLCAKMCTSTHGLAKHIFTHRSLKSSPCPKCRKLFVTSASFERHQSTHMEGIPFQTEQDFGFDAVHFAPAMYGVDTHQGAAGYTCDICHKMFDVQDKFELHQKTGCIFSAFLP